MRTTQLRRPIAVLALLPLLLLVGLLATACGSDDEGAAGDSTSESASDDASDEASEDDATEDDASDEGDQSDDAEESDEQEGTDSDLSAEDAAVCDPYLDMVEELSGLDYTAKPDAVAAEMGPIMKEWAAGVPDLDQPSSMDDGAWNGLQTLAGRVEELPDEPTNADITAVEEGLSAQEQQDVDAAGKWFESTCAAA